VSYLAQHHIPLDITPTSNVYLGVYPTYADHPLPQLYAAGVTITVSTDDPSLFNTTLNDEVIRLATDFSLDTNAIDEILMNGIRSSFLPAHHRQEMEAAFRSALVSLKTGVECLHPPDISWVSSSD
jgi:aminodeoxyfutalosine deaminase